jgi:hypothetical protein
MSTARRSFFALIGSAAVSGFVSHKATAATPMLILPPGGIIPASQLPTGAYPLLDQQKTLMHGFIAVMGGLPDELFRDWMEGGLRQVESCKPGGMIHRAMQMERG